MEYIDHETVSLKRGETIPVWCECGNIYKPPESSKSSVCMMCEKLNEHEGYEGMPFDPNYAPNYRQMRSLRRLAR